MLKSQPSFSKCCNRIWREGLYRGDWVKMRPWGPPLKWLMSLKEEGISGMCLHRGMTMWRGERGCPVKERDLTWNQPCWLFDLKLPASKKRSACYLVHSICANLLWQLWKTNTQRFRILFWEANFYFIKEAPSWAFGWEGYCKLPKEDRYLLISDIPRKAYFRKWP